MICWLCHLAYAMLQQHLYIWGDVLILLLNLLVIVYLDVWFLGKFGRSLCNIWEIVIQTLQEQSLQANMKKCEFARQVVVYIGFVDGWGKSLRHLEKTKGIMNWPELNFDLKQQLWVCQT